MSRHPVIFTNHLPLLCVPVFGRDAASLTTAAQAAKGAPLDMIEWRVDFLANLSQIPHALSALRGVLPDTPVLATFRTKEEGGEQSLPDPDYFEILRCLMETGQIDGIDIEYFHSPKDRQAAIARAKEAGLFVIVSSHHFDGTPAEGQMEALLETLVETGGIGKLAVMPKTPRDVLALLSATLAVKERYPDRPIITMAMGPLGVITRIAGETFGSALTFGTAGAASAPGQLPADTLRMMLIALHGEK